MSASIALAACAAPDPCRLLGAREAVVATLFFGLDVPGRAPVSDAEWDGFLRAAITPRFPDGLTVLEASGQWRDPATGRVGREPSRVVVVATEPATEVAGRLGAIADVYKRRFHQRSVGIVLNRACAAF